MDLEAVGRHAILFDDDSMAAFVNSADALVNWNSLSIDRYDVRHLLSAPPPPRSRHRHSPSFTADDALESELDHERYLDLPSPSEEQDLENGGEQENAGGYNAVPFSYGNLSESTNQKDINAESGFCPPFSVPEYLLQNLPPTEKVHQIIARTAMFVSKHGGQSEIVLRVKQGDNPTFGFLMPDHNLHPYFRFLVEHQELLKTNVDDKTMEESKAKNGFNQTGGALSLLGSVYGSGEDEEGTTDNARGLTKNASEEAANTGNKSRGSEQTDSSLSVAGKDDAVSKHPVASSKDKGHAIKRFRSTNAVKVGATTGVNKPGDYLGSVPSTMDKLQASPPGLPKVEQVVLEPPSDMKRAIDKIVEFILRNGKEFEAVLVQQDTKHGRFPFLLQSNQYYPYYLNILQNAQELRVAGKCFISQKHDLVGHGMERRAVSKESNALPLASDIPYDSDRKEKFKMVIGKSKKNDLNPPSKSSQPQVGVSIDAAAAAAILKAATTGIKDPKLEILAKISMNSIGQCPSSKGGESLRPQCSIQKQGRNEEPGVPVPVAKDIAKTAAIAAANEADSSEASLTREQKLKAERLKRAKMFAAMIKGGAAPSKSAQPCGFSVEPPDSGFSASGAQVADNCREREGSLVQVHVDTSGNVEMTEKKVFEDQNERRRSKRKYRTRSKIKEDDVKEDDEAGEEEVEEDKNHEHYKKRSHYSSRHSRDKLKHRKRHSSSKDKDSRRRHKRDSSLDDEDQCSRHQCKEDGSSNSDCRHSGHRHHRDSSPEYKHSHSRHHHERESSSDDEQRHSQHRHNKNTFSDDELRHSRHKRKCDSSVENEHSSSRSRHKDDQCGPQHRNLSEDENQHEAKSVMHGKMSPSEREADLEEGEILAKSVQSKVSEGSGCVSGEASVDVSKPYPGVKAPSQPSESTEVSDELRTKIRAMLMATL